MMISDEEADQIAAALHERAPWMADASTTVMNELRRRTIAGSGLAGAPPMILTGPPGIGKSAWTRHLADLLEVPVIHIDLGAAQSGAFSLVGVERGWGTASMGQLTRTILSNRIVNPVVIIEEIGIAQGAVASSAGNLPGIEAGFADRVVATVLGTVTPMALDRQSVRAACRTQGAAITAGLLPFPAYFTMVAEELRR